MEKIYSALIVDDELLARQDLKSILDGFSQIDILAEADSISSARKKIREQRPDIVFLDIELTGETGFDLLPHISTKTKIIFITAFDEYAIRAFEVNALDYLLKPVSRDRLRQTLMKLNADYDDKALPHSLSIDDTIFLKLNDSYRFVKIRNIVLIEAADDYSMIYTSDGKQMLASKSMKEWEMRLPENFFCRIHRSSIINLEAVKKIEPWYNHAYLVHLDSIEKSAIMSRRYFSQIKKRLG